MPDKDILCYICGWSHGSLCVLFRWWFNLWNLWGIWLVDIIVLPIELHTHSAPFPNPSIGDPVLSLMVGCQALTEPQKTDISCSCQHAHLASTLVSVFGDCIWDGSPDVTVSGWLFLPFFFM